MSAPALTVRGLSVHLGGQTVLADVSLDIGAGELVAVVGRSGAGKSVMWKAVSGLLARARGHVVVHRPPLIFVHQDPALLDDRSVRDNLALGQARREVDGLVGDVAATFGLGALLDIAAHRLSPAQARRVALARALTRRPGVLVVDEPTTGLDVVAAADVERALAAASQGGAAVVVITHHPRTLATLAQRGARLLEVAGGGVIERRAA